MSTTELILGDCLEKMKDIDDESIDLILCDLTYGTTACKWDNIIPFEPLWEQYNRIIKNNGAIVLFATQPFTSKLIVSNLNSFKYSWAWIKNRPNGFINCKLKPLKNIEDICVFSNGSTANGAKNNMKYYPQDLQKINKIWSRPNLHKRKIKENSIIRENHTISHIQEYSNYPRETLYFDNVVNNIIFHPTQKPVDLLEYLIKTYSMERETVLDNTMGSGSTGCACFNTNRNFIGIEMCEKYFEIATNRIEKLRNKSTLETHFNDFKM